MRALWALVESSFDNAWRAEALLATSTSRRAVVARIGVPYLHGEEERAHEERWSLGDPQRRAAA